VVEAENNPGSGDVALLLLKCEDMLSKISAVDETTEMERKTTNESKLKIVHTLWTTLMGVRHAVSHHITRHSKRLVTKT
jgi:hypothetical protein